MKAVKQVTDIKDLINKLQMSSWGKIFPVVILLSMSWFDPELLGPTWDITDITEYSSRILKANY